MALAVLCFTVMQIPAQGGESSEILDIVEDSTEAMVPGVEIAATHLATAQRPESEPLSLQKAIDLAATGQLDRAEQILISLEKAKPKDAEVQYNFGLVLLKQGRLEDAGRRLESAAKLDPQSPLVWLAVAQVRLRQGDTTGASQAAEQARSTARQEPTVLRARAKFHHLLGKAYTAQSKPAPAVQQLQEAIRLDPSQASCYTDLAQLFLDHHTPEPAEMVLGNAVRRLPKDAELFRMLGLAYYAQGKKKEALDSFLNATELDRDLESAYASLETLLPEAGDRLTEITQRLRGFAGRRPSSPVGPYLLALALLDQPAETERLLRKAIQVAPDFWPAYYELQRLLKSQGEWKAAAEALENTIQLNPDFAPAHYSLAEVYNRLGDRVRARQERQYHHQLLTEQQAALEKRRENSPKLSYQLSEP